MGQMVNQRHSDILMNKNCLIVFAKNIVLGKVKTRLAKTIGDTGAVNVYIKLYNITEQASSNVKDTDIQIHFSDEILEGVWPNASKFVQSEGDLGQRMNHAFKNAFEQGYEKVICIGTDLPEMNTEIIEKAFKKLDQTDFVFGPAADGGYYLVGSNEPQSYIFQNKPWSTDGLLELTLNEITENKHTYTQLDILNDIDTVEDLEKSVLSEEFKHYYELLKRDK